MAKENEFVEILQNSVEDGVLDRRTEPEKKRDELIALISELEANVIKDPKQIDKLKKELANVEKELKAGQVQENIVKNEAKSVEGKSVEEIEKEAEEKSKKDEQAEEMIVQEPDREDGSTEKAYEDAMQLLHDFRIKMYANQMSNPQHIKLVCTKEEFMHELELEKKNIALKTKYKASLGEQEDALKEKEEKLAREERQAREPIQREIRERSRKYAEAMVALHKVNLELAYIHELMQKDKISPEDYAARKEKALNEQRKIKDQIAELNPEELMKAMEEEKLRKKERARVLGQDFERQSYKQASYEEKKNLDYEKSKKLKQEGQLEFAEKEKVQNTQSRIEEREEHIKRLKKELDELPESDIERRFEILKEMEIENLQLEHDQEQMDRIDRGETLEPDEEIKENAAIEQEVQEIIEQQQEDYAETHAAIEAIEKREGEVALEAPQSEIELEEERRKKIVAGAIVSAAVLGDENDTPREQLSQAVAGAVITEGLTKDDSLAKNMPGLLAYNDPNNPEDAKAILAQDKQIEAAKEELAKNQAAIEKEVGNI